jgi:hypothetical protein
MLKLAVWVLSLVLAGSASAAGWRSLHIDGTSEDSFNESVAALKEKLPRVRQHVLERSLQDIWMKGMKAAQADGRDYTIGDHLRELDGLGYKDVVEFTDPSGDTADRYWDQAYVNLYGRGAGTQRFRRQWPNMDTPYPYGLGRLGVPDSD